MRKFIYCLVCIWVLAADYGLAQEWKEYKTNHFLIFYENAPMGFVKNVERAAERYYEDITNDLGYARYDHWSYDERAQIYIYDNQEHYANALSTYGWSHGVASPKDKVIRTFPAAHGFFDSTLPHEITHIIFREFVGFKAQVPLWFEEGVAMFHEQAKRFGAHEIARQAIENKTFIPLSELNYFRPSSNTEKERINLFYAESASIVNYLITEQGQSRFVRFCRKLEEGGPFEWVLESVYVRFKNLDKLNDEWVKYLKHE